MMQEFTITPGMIDCARDWGHTDVEMAAFEPAVWRLFDPQFPENLKANHRAYIIKPRSPKPTPTE